jgi:multidrug efflux pump
MFISDICIRRPVLAMVISLILVIFGMFSFVHLPVREFPDVDPPIVNVATNFRGASAEVMESQVTQVMESAVSGISGIKTISSTSREEASRVNIEFSLSRNIDVAAADVRDKVSRAVRDLPDEVDAPVVQKADADDVPIMSLSLTSDTFSRLEMTDYASRVLVDRFATVDGVANVRMWGAREYSMRIWLDKNKLAARELTVKDVEQALQRENVELPSGRLESSQREFTVRTESGLKEAEQFGRIVIGSTKEKYLTRLRDVATVEKAAKNTRSEVYINNRTAVGIVILKQSKANTLEVADGVRAELATMRATLPDGMNIDVSYDESQFISRSIYEVFHALGVALILVIAVVFFFLRTVRATLIPAIAIPVSIIASFSVLAAIGFSINVLTLLAFVLAIGLVVDDAIVVLENVHRRIEQGEPVLLAAVRGSRQIGFAVIVTTLVLVAVFLPIAFIEGNIGRLFSEFGVAVAFAVLFSGVVALTLTPMMCARILRPAQQEGRLVRMTEPFFDGMHRAYAWTLDIAFKFPLIVVIIAVAAAALSVVIFLNLRKEFSPTDDRGSFSINITGPEGASLDYMKMVVGEVEGRLKPLVDRGLVDRIFTSVAPGFDNTSPVNSARITVRLVPWDQRTERASDIVAELTPVMINVPWARVRVDNPPGLGRRLSSAPVQFVVMGDTYDELVKVRDQILIVAADNPRLLNLTSDYIETKPQLRVDIDRNRASDLGVSVRDIGETLQTLLGSKVVTHFTDRGELYDVIVQARADNRVAPRDLSNVYVRSNRGALIPLANVVKITDVAGPSDLRRLDRMRAITLQATLARDYTLAEALSYMEETAAPFLSPNMKIGYRGQSKDYKDSSASLYYTFAFAIVVVFLVLAAQFESFLNPFIILLAVPLAVTGALGSLMLAGISLNVYSQIGIILLVGLVAKNGILIVEFSNQLRNQGHDILAAVREASISRLRPILMTSITNIFGALPLAIASGAGAESRNAIGITIIGGVLFSTALTLVVIPVFYLLLAKRTKPTGAIAEMITRLERDSPAAVPVDAKPVPAE